MFDFFIEASDTKSKARAGVFSTPHGTISTPVFMPVGTQASVKTLSSEDLNEIKAQIILGNAYHLYLRPGSKTIKELGGIHKFMNFKKPILTDSGGYQVFSLGKNSKGTNNVKIFDEGIEFKSHLDGSKHFFSPEKVMEIEHDLGADIIMQIDECAPWQSDYSYAKLAMERTHRFSVECLKHHKEKQKNTKVPQALFPIVQGTIFKDLRIESAKFISSLNSPGIAIGGLSVGEERKKMLEIIEIVEEHLPKNKPRYLMGVGTPTDLLNGIERGIDMFDCVDPTRIARHGAFYDHSGRHSILNSKFTKDKTPLSDFFLCRNYSKAYIQHLIKSKETLGLRILSINNLCFLIDLMEKCREAIIEGNFKEFKKKFSISFKGK